MCQNSWLTFTASPFYFRKVYWVDAWKKKLYSAPVHGNDVSIAVDLAPYVGQNPAFGLVMVEGTALVGVWGTGQVRKEGNIRSISFTIFHPIYYIALLVF